MSDAQHTSTDARRGRSRQFFVFGAVLAVAAISMFVVTFVLVTMFQHKQEARTPFIRVVEVNEVSTDPRPWGLNWPNQYDGYLRTAEGVEHGGSSALAASKLESSPWLKRLYAGYAFSLDYREARGHAYMLYDQTATERVTKRQQSGACLHCHASNTVAYRRVGLEAMGQDASDAALAADLNMPAIIRGFQEVSRKPYHEVLAVMAGVPDGTPDDDSPLHPTLDQPRELETPAGHIDLGNTHPVSCIDCHDPATMAIRVTRPGFVLGIGALAASDEPVPHMPSIDRWRKGGRGEPYDPNELASRQEMRSFVCGQCHVEYYCADKMTLTFPWGNGLKVEQIEQFWDETTFPDDGGGFYDYAHGETGAKLYKAQHPEFELWSQGIHAANGVSCVDCHMPYERQGAMKASNHHVQSPLLNVNNACQHCHNIPEAEIIANVRTIQNRTVALMERAAAAMTEMLDAVLEAKAAGATDEQLAPVYDLQRKAMWRLDYISSENSKGFHADQEAARILGESIDYSRQAQAMALRLRAPDAPSTEGIPTEGVQGVTPAGEAPR
jgi:nitrite reductase (cytochrome c-552)